MKDERKKERKAELKAQRAAGRNDELGARDELGDTERKVRTPMSNKKFMGIWIPILAFFTLLTILLNIGLNMFSTAVASQFGSGTWTFEPPPGAEHLDTQYVRSRFETREEADQATRDLIEQLAEGGIVLAHNPEGALPLPATARRVTLFGRSSVDPILSGSGSGAVDTRTAILPGQGLENAGFTINSELYDDLREWAAPRNGNWRGRAAMDNPLASTFYIGEPTVDFYQAHTASFAQYNDAAIVFIGRPGGEGDDLTRDMTEWDAHAVPGQHQLQLNYDERQMIALAQEHFDTVIIVLNVSTSFEAGELVNDPDIDAILVIGFPGATGMNALGRILAGQVNPSGRLAATWARDFTANPTFVNFGNFNYENFTVNYPTALADRLTFEAATPAWLQSGLAPFVNYAEGIFVGYRWYETAAYEGFFNFEDAVVFPFGWGLSYTSFDWEVVQSEVGDLSGDISITVRVTNTGTVPGRDVVQVYHTAPWDPALNIEVAHVVLRGFAKTDTIAPGGHEDVTITIPVESLASYDHRTSRAWVMLPGEHLLTVRHNSHDVAEGTEPVVFSQPTMHVFDTGRSTDLIPVTNLFDDVSDMFVQTPQEGRILELSRRDFAGTFPTPPSPDLFIANDEIIAGFQPWDYVARAARYDGPMPRTGVHSGLTLVDLRGLPFDHPLWTELLDSLTVSEMIELLAFGAYRTAPIASIAKPETIDVDGPAGFSSFISELVQGQAYPSQALIAQTWDVDLARAQGRMLGNEALHLGVSGWYAPGLNLHRSPFGGRNFEYYSEDPFLSGMLGNEVSSGLGEYGVYTMIKHFAVNEQEMNRKTNGLASWLTEQALREIYLPPFEIPIKNTTFVVPYLVDGEMQTTTKGAMGVMSAFTRIGATWTGGDYRLMQTILRDEWGFEGFVISDFNLYPYMSPNQSIYAGTDLTLSLTGRTFEDTTSAAAVSDMRRATHRVLFGVANSNAMNGIAPGAIGHFDPPTWMLLQRWGTVAMSALILGGTALVIRRVLKHRRAAELADSGAFPGDGDGILVETVTELVDA